MSTFKIKGNRLVITGGTGGIGSALVKGFIDAGTEVLVSARDAAHLMRSKNFSSQITRRLQGFIWWSQIFQIRSSAVSL
jgi:short-subunit dehydrogenase involved in D-alanine esterification of teichoic acids